MRIPRFKSLAADTKSPVTTQRCTIRHNGHHTPGHRSRTKIVIPHKSPYYSQICFMYITRLVLHRATSPEAHVNRFQKKKKKKALLLYVGIPSLSFNGLDGDTHAGSQASGSCANLNTPIGTQVPRTVLTLIYPDAVSIPILCHLRHKLMMLRNPSGLCRNLQMLYRIPI
jgi:hypothetical protein